MIFILACLNSVLFLLNFSVYICAACSKLLLVAFPTISLCALMTRCLTVLGVRLNM